MIDKKSIIMAGRQIGKSGILAERMRQQIVNYIIENYTPEPKFNLARTLSFSKILGTKKKIEIEEKKEKDYFEFLLKNKPLAAQALLRKEFFDSASIMINDSLFKSSNSSTLFTPESLNFMKNFINKNTLNNPISIRSQVEKMISYDFLTPEVFKFIDEIEKELTKTCNIPKSPAFHNIEKGDWICTDPDNEQYMRKISETVYEFKETSKEFNKTVTGEIDLNEYSEGEKLSCVAAYGYELNSIDSDLLAECLWEYYVFFENLLN